MGINESLTAMYELGKEHGYELAKKDFEIKQLEDEVNELIVEIETCDFCGSQPLSANCNGAKCDV